MGLSGRATMTEKLYEILVEGVRKRTDRRVSLYYVTAIQDPEQAKKQLFAEYELDGLTIFSITVQECSQQVMWVDRHD